MPLDVKQAYINGTRSYDGRPGPNYWQNHSDYKIKVAITPETRLLSGGEDVTYYNDSPDTLRQLVVRLYQDIHKGSNARDFGISPESITDGVILKNLSVGDMVLSLDDSAVERRGTNLYIRVPVFPHSTVTLGISWEFTIPERGIRMGAYDSTSFMIAYWYPQIAVYDDIDGWDETEYTGRLEFYNDFSNFDVEISVPQNYCVWATGALQNPEQVFTSEYLELYNLALCSDSVIHIITQQSITDNEQRTTGNYAWHFRAESVPDFAFALSSTYLWDAVSYAPPADSEQLTTNNPKNRILIAAAYDPISQNFYEVCSISRAAIEYFSIVFPAVTYPYARMTIFNGSGGMEFPMMVNESDGGDRAGTVFVTTHEIAHTYFPFYMGINERRYAWMDEGWATMLPLDLQKELAPEGDPRARMNFRYLNTAGTMWDLPMMTLSGNLGNFRSYGFASYFKPGCAYDILRKTLGEEAFDKALRQYMSRWHGKHPSPYDFFFTFNDVTDQNLDWFFKPWFFESGYPDLAIDKAEVEGDEMKVTIKRVGALPVPIEIRAGNMTMTESASVWSDGKTSKTLTLPYTSGIEIFLGSPYIPDADKSNNVYIIK
jgi:hypothetical protein